MISETKVDHFFPVGQFLSDGFGALFDLDQIEIVEVLSFSLEMIFLQKFFL